MMFLSNLLARSRGLKTYVFSVFITGVAGFGMYTGKLDYNTGMEMITTVGVGSFLRSAVNTQAPPSLAPAPPYPTAPQSPASVTPVPAAAVAPASLSPAATPSPADSYTSDTNDNS